MEYPDRETYRKLYARYLTRRPASVLLDFARGEQGLRGKRVVDLCGGAGELSVGAVERVILDTEKHVPSIRASREVVDLDLWPIGTGDFWDQAPLIRAEFEHLSEELWAEGRSKWLRSMLDREAIFVSGRVPGGMEATARANLEKALEQLGGAP